MGIPKSSSMAFTSCCGPSTRAASILLAPVARALGTNRSRGIDRIDAAFVFGFTCRIMTTSLLTPVTPSEHRPNALFWCLSAHRDVDPTRTMFSTPEGGSATRLPTLMRWISWPTYSM